MIHSDESLLKVSSGDQIPEMTLKLFPGGVISGVVTDADGDPVRGDEVVLWDQSESPRGKRQKSVSQAKTDASGLYRFDGLSPGTYFVSASAGEWGDVVRPVPVDSAGKITKIHDLTTFHPAALSIGEAEAISVESGQEHGSVNVQIRRGSTLAVRGKIAGPLEAIRNYSLDATVADGGGETSVGAAISPDGSFVFSELPPGEHTLTLADHDSSGFRVVGDAEVDLVDADVSGVVITPFQPAAVRVRVVLEGAEDKPLTNGSVSLNPTDGAKMTFRRGSGVVFSEPQNNAYHFSDVRPGQYQVWFNNAADCFVKSVKSGEQVLDPESVSVGGGADLDLLMILSKGVASLNGNVVMPDTPSSRETVQPPVHVLLLSRELPQPLNGILHARLDQMQHFTADHLRPGNYMAFAVEDDDTDVWSREDFAKRMQAEGAEIELHEKENATAQLRWIPKAETDRVRKQLGF